VISKHVCYDAASIDDRQVISIFSIMRSKVKKLFIHTQFLIGWKIEQIYSAISSGLWPLSLPQHQQQHRRKKCTCHAYCKGQRVKLVKQLQRGHKKHKYLGSVWFSIEQSVMVFGIVFWGLWFMIGHSLLGLLNMGAHWGINNYRLLNYLSDFAERCLNVAIWHLWNHFSIRPLIQ